MRRIHVVGTSCSGKTALARELASRLGVPHVEIDAMYWGPNWTGTPREVFRSRVERELRADAWVVDGNYGDSLGDIIGRRRDMLVWLDYPLVLVLWRWFRRTSSRIVRRTELWSGNRERFSTALVARDGLLMWILTSRPVQRRRYPALLAAHPGSVRLRSPSEARRWLAGLSA